MTISAMPAACRRRNAWSTSGSPRNGTRPLSRPPARVPAPPARITAAIASATLDMADQTLPLLLLALGERIDAALEGIRAVAEIEAHRGTDELEALAEEILEVALVRLRERLDARAVDDDARRQMPAHVRVAQLRGAALHERRLVGLVGGRERL